MRRRTFLRNGIITGLSVSLAGCNTGDSPEKTPTGNETTSTQDGTTSDSTTNEPNTPESLGQLTGAPQFQYDPANTGSITDEAEPKDSVASAWVFKSTGTPLYSSATVVDGMIYIIGADSGDNELLPIETTNGSQSWVYNVSPSIRSTPAVANGTVYVGGSHRDEELYALDATSDARQWSFDMLGFAPGAPTVANGTVYIGAVRQRQSDALYAVNAETGEQNWVFEKERRIQIHTTPAVADGSVFVGGDYLYSVDSNTGELQWKFEGEGTGHVLSAPTVFNQTVYIEVDGTFYALDVDSGEKQWATDIGENASGNTRSSPVITDHIVYKTGTSLYALDIASGDIQWTFESGDSEFTQPIAVNGMIYTGGDNLYAIDGQSGDTQWTFGSDEIDFFAPTVTNGVVIAGATDSNVYALY